MPKKIVHYIVLYIFLLTATSNSSSLLNETGIQKQSYATTFRRTGHWQRETLKATIQNKQVEQCNRWGRNRPDNICQQPDHFSHDQNLWGKRKGPSFILWHLNQERKATKTINMPGQTSTFSKRYTKRVNLFKEDLNVPQWTCQEKALGWTYGPVHHVQTSLKNTDGSGPCKDKEQ